MGIGENAVTVLLSKSNRHDTCGITLKRVKSSGVRFCGLALDQHISNKMSQWWRAVGDAVSNLTGPGIETWTSCTVSGVFNHYANRPVV